MSSIRLDDCTFWYTTEYLAETSDADWQDADRLDQVPARARQARAERSWDRKDLAVG